MFNKKFSHAVANALIPRFLRDQSMFVQEPKDSQHAPGTYIESILIVLMKKALPRGQKRSLGPTHPLRGEIEYERQVKLQEEGNKISVKTQFPCNDKLPDGRHRYYLKNGALVDRAN
jgi:hypothetical protein